MTRSNSIAPDALSPARPGSATRARRAPRRRFGLGLGLGLSATLAALAACQEEEALTPREVAEAAVVMMAEGDARATSYFKTDFVDHQTGTVGTTALREQILATEAATPDGTAQVYRVLSEGDLVFVHGHVTPSAGALGHASADFFRFEDGQITEHWGARQAVPATTVSGNDMFSTLSAPVRFDADPAADPAQTMATMGALASALIVDKDLSAWDRYIEPPYYQHSTNTANGVEAVKEVWGPIIADPTVVITPMLNLAEGDLFVTMNQIDSPTLHLTTVDLSRVRDSLIHEHWDVVEQRL